MKIKAVSKVILTLGTALLLNQVSLNAQTCNTVGDFGPGAGHAIVSDAEGNIYAAGVSTDGQGLGHAVVMKNTNTGATWLPVDDFNYLPGLPSFFWAMGVDAADNVYAAGTAFTVCTSSVKTGHWIVRRSADHGMTWATVDHFVLPGGTYNGSDANSFTKDSAGNLYVVGGASVVKGKGSSSSQTGHWIVRKSADGGNNWFTVDDFLYTTDGNPIAKGVVCTTSGVFVVGYGYKQLTINKLKGAAAHWLVRRSTNAGTNWTTVDDYQYLGNPTNAAAAKGGIAADAAGNLYVLGTGMASDNLVHWLARKSVDGGATWSLVDDFLHQGSFASPNAVGVDALGNIYGVGAGGNQWLVRASGPSGTAWTTVDDFRYSTNQSSIGFGFGASPAGNVFTIGIGNDSSRAHWVVREATP